MTLLPSPAATAAPVERCAPAVPAALAGRLPALSPQDAALHRLTRDSRFSAWLRTTLQHPSLGVSLRGSSFAWRLTVECDHGRFQLGLDAADSPALQLALAHEPHDTACAVVAVLLEDWAQAFTSVLGPLRLLAIAPAGADPDTAPAPASPPLWPCVLGGGLPVALLAADAPVLAQVSSAMARSGVDLSPLADWPVRPVIRLFSRPLPLAALRSLRPGDAVLAGGQQPRLRCGVGHLLHARVHIDPQEFTVYLAEAPFATDDPDDAGGMADPAAAAAAPGIEAPAAAGSLEALQLPVAFELDTARVSLAELASMQPGHALELDVPLQEAQVRLVSHGRTLGLGQLIAIGDQLGVRITRLEFSHDATAAR